MKTPEQFAAAMSQAAKDRDTESAHATADDIMCELLRELGYEEGVEIFEQMEKWYA